MINKYLFIILIIFNFSCNAEKNNIDFKDNIMKDNVFYFIEYDYNNKCGFEIYINDILVKSYLKPVNIDNSVTPINPYIINSGRQEVKIILYPYDNKEIPDDANFTLKVFSVVNNDNNVVTSSNQGNIIYVLPKLIINKNSSSWNIIDSFDIKNLPYTVDGWKKSKDLTKINDIEQKVRDKFLFLKSTIDNKDSNLFIKMFNKSISESKRFYYLTDQQEKNSITEIKQLISKTNIHCESISNTLIKFYAKGRLVTLETQDQKSALRLIEEGENYSSESSFPILLHIPEGSDELEVIR
jgi:hypothetical protein